MKRSYECELISLIFKRALIIRAYTNFTHTRLKQPKFLTLSLIRLSGLPVQPIRLAVSLLT